MKTNENNNELVDTYFSQPSKQKKIKAMLKSLKDFTHYHRTQKEGYTGKKFRT